MAWSSSSQVWKEASASNRFRKVVAHGLGTDRITKARSPCHHGDMCGTNPGGRSYQGTQREHIAVSSLRALESYVGAAPALPSAYWGGCEGIR